MSNRFSLRLVLAITLVSVTASACAGVRASLPGAPPPASSPARAEMRPRNGLEVIGAMRRAHPSRALKSVAFTVTTTGLRPDTGRPVLARAVAALPGRFRVTTLPSSRRSGFVRDQQRIAVFERGRRVVSQNRVDVATLLAYDVYAQGIDSTIRWLDAAQVRLGLVRRDRFDGKAVWVVGAEENDTTSTQFWVDADRWRVVRVIQRDPRAPATLMDVRFREFTDVLDVPLPTRIDIHRRGGRAQQQVISNVAPNPRVPPRAFDLSRWRDVGVGD